MPISLSSFDEWFNAKRRSLREQQLKQESEMVMKRGDFRKIAEVMNTSRRFARYGSQKELWNEIVNQFALCMSNENPAFSISTFLNECGDVNAERPDVERQRQVYGDDPNLVTAEAMNPNDDYPARPGAIIRTRAQPTLSRWVTYNENVAQAQPTPVNPVPPPVGAATATPAMTEYLRTQRGLAPRPRPPLTMTEVAMHAPPPLSDPPAGMPPLTATEIRSRMAQYMDYARDHNLPMTHATSQSIRRALNSAALLDAAEGAVPMPPTGEPVPYPSDLLDTAPEE